MPPTTAPGPEYQVSEPTVSARRYVVIMVGLPARGKTFLANKLCRLLGWLGHRATVFNVQRMWRDLLSGRAKANGVPSWEGVSLDSDTLYARAASSDRMDSDPAQGGECAATTPLAPAFDFERNTDSAALYREALRRCAAQVEAFFDAKGLVAFINDDFVSEAIRGEAEALLQPLCDSLFYIEVVGPSNPTFDLRKVECPDEYGGAMPLEPSLADFNRRVKVLEAQYTPVEKSRSYIRVRSGECLEIRGVHGYIPSRMVSFLMNLNHTKVSNPIYFTRHGESAYNLEDRIGGNPELTAKGRKDAQYLRAFVASIKAQEEAAGQGGRMQIWTSQLTRAMQTAAPSEALGITAERWSCLNEIHAGVCEDLTYAEVKQQYPMIHDFRKQLKYTFRYPRGESYQDLVARLEPVIMELENADRVVVVVSHQAVLRALLAYFGTSSAEASVNVDVPHRTVWKCSFNSTGIAALEKIRLGIDTPELDLADETPASPAGAAAAATNGVRAAPTEAAAAAPE